VIGEHRVLEKGPGLLAPSSLLYIRVFVCSFRSFVFVLFSGRGASSFRQADRRELQCSPLSSAVGVLKASRGQSKSALVGTTTTTAQTDDDDDGDIDDDDDDDDGNNTDDGDDGDDDNVDETTATTTTAR
jgi:hypothetical protein